MNLKEIKDKEISDEQRQFRRQVKIAATVYVVIEAVMILVFILGYRK